jgi:DNA mismatch repair protein MutS
MLVGGFYELYDVIDPASGEPKTSMKRAVEVLGIQLKIKEKDAAGLDGLFAGFPKDSLMKYVALLTRENWTVAVYDQVDAVGKQRKDRTLARIYSPGTTEGADVYLGAVWFTEAGAFAAAVVDLTTGAFTTYEGAAAGADSWITDDLAHFFQVHPPKELVVWWQGAPIAMPSEMDIRKMTGATGLIHRRAAVPIASTLHREDLLRKAFGLKGIIPVKAQLAFKGLEEHCVTALLVFIEDHYMSVTTSLSPPVTWTPATAVFLGNHALTQLNMIAHRPEDSVLGLYLKTYTAFGRRAMRTRLLYPVCDPLVLENRYKQLEWCLQAQPLDSLRQIEDLPKLHQKIRLAQPTAADFLLLDKSYQTAKDLMKSLRGTPLALAPAVIQEVDNYLVALEAVVSIDKARRSSENLFCLQNAAAPKVAAVEAELASTEAKILATLNELIVSLGLTPGSLRLEYKEASVVVSGTKAVMGIAAKALTSVAGAQIHAKKSSTSLEIPALNALYRAQLGLRSKLQEAIREELPGICDGLAVNAATWIRLEDWIASVDIAATMAKVAESRGFCRPELVEGAAAGLDATGLAHPLIEGQQNRLEYVRHAVSLGSKAKTNGWLVYGMNASGKSSLMKSVGIAVILAQAGSYVPATTFRYTPFRAIFTRILNKDDLWAGLSSFAVEMTELNEIIRRSDENSLVLGDEVCSGTESDSATALVGAALQWMGRSGARYIFATHLHGLHALPEVAGLETLKVWHLRVRRDGDRLVYDRTLQPGAGSSLYGLEVAKAMGLPLEFLEGAHAIRKRLTGGEATSRWNAEVVRKDCEICGSAATEVHHVIQRASAVAGRLADGSSMNNVRNLVTVCEACHDKHHKGEIQIGQVRLTSEGPIRDVETVSSQHSTVVNEDIIRQVEDHIRLYPKSPLKRMAFDLEREGVKISIQRIRSIRDRMI